MVLVWFGLPWFWYGSGMVLYGFVWFGYGFALPRERDLQREQKAKYLFFGLKESSHTNIYCFYIAFPSTGRNPARRRAAGGGPPSCWVAIW
jgi:hypothetical protein